MQIQFTIWENSESGPRLVAEAVDLAYARRIAWFFPMGGAWITDNYTNKRVTVVHPDSIRNPHGKLWSDMSDEELEAAKHWCMLDDHHNALRDELLNRYHANRTV